MIHITQAVQLGGLDAIVLEIWDRKKLRQKMVGSLYPSVVTEEIGRLVERFDTLGGTDLRERLDAVNNTVNQITKYYDDARPHIICPVDDPGTVEHEINQDGWSVGDGWWASDPAQKQPDGRWLLYVECLDDDTE